MSTNSLYLSGNLAPVTDEITVEDLEVTGSVPSELEGRWLRNGPNPVGDVEAESYHWFTGSGMVHGVRLRDGRAEWYRNRWIRGDAETEALGEDPVSRPEGAKTGMGPNTSVGGFAGHTWALVEAGLTPMKLSYELESVAFDDFGGTLANGFSAHPKYDATTGELHAMCYSWPDLVDHVEYVVVGADGRVIKKVDVPVPDMPMIHDMSLTDNWAIVYDLPITVSLDLVAQGSTFPFAWNPEHPSRVGLLDRTAETADDIIWCDAPARYVFHPLNAYEAEGRVVVDLCAHGTKFKNDVQGPLGDDAPTLDRWTVDPTARTVTEERVDDRAHEMPGCNPQVSRRKHRFGYTMEATSNPITSPASTFKTDFETGAVVEHDHGEGRGGGEPIFVPRADGTAEDDGWVMVAVYDAERDSSDLVVIDAQNFGTSEVARVHFPRRVPEGFHGAWVPDASVPPT